ncbi:uncharacterized protein LOC143277631 isoform X2 [Babylonia areolata]|uniref:uncharacterized protein LOC143277631 isoform X2 n=1 Tax=Babylonia areolata TaxID=304850 RepID=UPI003FCFB7F7
MMCCLRRRHRYAAKTLVAGLFVFVFFFCGSNVCLSSKLTLNRPECTSGKELFLVDKQDVLLTCSGMERQWNIYWSLAGGRGGQQRIADCTGCDQNNCHGCSMNINQPHYTLVRYHSSSTIRFRADSQTHDGATLTCSTFNNANRVSCRLRVVQQITPHLPNCSNGQIVLPENRETAITCTGLTSQYTVYWAMRGVTPGGTGFERLGDCTQCTQLPCPRCDPPKAGYSFSRTPTTTALKFRADYEDHNGAVVMCSSYPGHTSQTCELKVVKDYKMPQCHGGWLDLVEDENVPPTVTCTQLTSNQSMGWFLFNNNKVHHVASCFPCTKEPCTQQCQVQRDDFRVSRTATSTSLTVVRNVRALAGQKLNCFLQKEIQENCLISVLHNAQLSEPRVTMHSNWTVTGIVTFDHAFTSRGQIGCRWTRKSVSGQSEIPEREVKLQEQEEDEGGRRFFGGSCVMVTSLSDTSGDVYNFTVEVTPGAGPVLAGSVTIKKPGEPRSQKSSCPDVIAEGQDVSCKCRHTSSSKPSPPALLTWVDSSTSSDVLELRNISREQNGRVHVCRSVWGPGGEVVSSVSYSPRVVYGPSKVTVTRDDDLDPQNVTLTCKVQGEVFPSASLTWNVPCASVSDTNVSSTCTLRRDQVDRSGRDVVVECVATNSELSSLNATASLSFPDGEEPKRGKPLPLMLIIGIASGVFVIVTVVIVIISVLRRKKRPKKSSKAVSPADNHDGDDDDSEFQEYINDLYGTSMDLVTYNANGPVVNPSAPQPDAAPSTSSAPAPTAGPAIAATRGDNVPGSSVTSGQSGASEMASGAGNVASGIPEGSGEVYAEVQKTKKDNDAAPNAFKVTEVENNVYAQVQKKKKKAKAKAEGGEEEKPADETVHGCDQEGAMNYENWTSTGENSGEVYTNVGQLPSTAARPDDDDGDDYHNLQFHRPSTEADDALYNHLHQT